MNDFNRCNKATGVHWLKNSLENIQMRIKLKHQDGTLSLPKFDDYTTESTSTNIQNLENQTEEFNFKWQEKVFSVWELQRYSDIHNCISETELTYHDMIENEDYIPSKVFTYLHEDCHLPLPTDLKSRKKIVHILNLSSCFEGLSLGRVGRVFREDTSSMGHLFRSEENITSEEQWRAMHVVFDNSEYNEDSQLLLKQEVTLLSLYHNTALDYLIISPDVNNLDLNPYSVETATGVPLGYQYAVEVDFDGMASAEELVALLRKLYKKWEKKQKQILNFVMPPLGKKLYCVALEILSATNFEMDNLYIEYNIKIPENTKCSDVLRGRTHTSKALRTSETDEWHFGQLIELSLETMAGTEPPLLKIFFEVISTDWWGRHRTEGYTYLALTLDPGRFTKQLSCSRPEELDSVQAESRRFFIGGCHLIKDLEILAQPQMHDCNFKFVSTGNITFQWSIISQAYARSAAAIRSALPTVSSASALLMGAEAALKKYKKARAKLAAATEEFTSTEKGSETVTASGDK